MGGENFETKQSAPTADEAFKLARENALHEYGHRGYTGTIAEKDSFRMIETKIASDDPTPLAAAIRLARACQDNPNHWCDEKWGPAACIDAGPDPKKKGNRIWIFFGVASS